MTHPAGQPGPDGTVRLLDAPVRYRAGRADALTELAPQTGADHRAEFGPLPSAAGLRDAVATAGLTGHGGAHRPVAAKWDRGPVAVVVANGAESEPLSRKDAALLEFRPHLVLDGLALTASVVGADRAVVWLHDDAHRARSALTRALAERADGGRFGVSVGPRRYVAGQSSAALAGVAGRPALPVHHRTARRDGLVHNVETLARIALVARGLTAAGALVTVALGDDLIVVDAAPHAALGATVRSVVGDRPLSAALVGGYGGRWNRWTDAARRPLGARLGLVVCLASGTCGLRRTEQIARYLAGQSAGQCGPCVSGLPAVADATAALVAGRARARARLERWCAELSGRGACAHPDGAVALVSSALDVFADNIAAHRRGTCVEDRVR